MASVDAVSLGQSVPQRRAEEILLKLGFSPEAAANAANNNALLNETALFTIDGDYAVAQVGKASVKVNKDLGASLYSSLINQNSASCRKRYTIVLESGDLFTFDEFETAQGAELTIEERVNTWAINRDGSRTPFPYTSVTAKDMYEMGVNLKNNKSESVRFDLAHSHISVEKDADDSVSHAELVVGKDGITRPTGFRVK